MHGMFGGQVEEQVHSLKLYSVSRQTKAEKRFCAKKILAKKLKKEVGFQNFIKNTFEFSKSMV